MEQNAGAIHVDVKCPGLAVVECRVEHRAKRLGAKDWLIKTEFDPEEVLEKVIAQIGK